MEQFVREIDANFLRFSSKWKAEIVSNTTALSNSQTDFEESYKRLVSLQAWRSSLLESKLSSESFAFFIEAQNDALISHTQIQIGSWRVALMALRSCIENTINCLYYKDHPIEYLLWEEGKFKLGFTAGISYLKSHPALSSYSAQLIGIETIEKEYATLSRAVHASSKGFRMTEGQNKTRLWNITRAVIGSWAAREAKVILAVNSLLLALFKEDLQGTRLSNLRQAISLIVPVSKHSDIQQKLGISLQDPSA